MTIQDAMHHALMLARRGTGMVSPNPRVGCVIMHDGSILSEGWHARYGQAHAEVMALQQCPHPPASAVLVVTLEPCSHVGKTPPCADAIIASGIRTVVVGMVDPNPAVAGRGIQRLRDAGITVHVGIEEAQCQWLNRWFTTSMTQRRASLVTKIAQSLDGSMTSASGSSQWITSNASRRIVHELRAECDAVLVGIGTAVADDPQLTVRFAEGRHPVRMVLDPTARLPRSSALVRTAHDVPVIIWHAPNACPERRAALTDAGVRCMELPLLHGHIPFRQLLESAFLELGLTSILLEGGPATIAEALRQESVDELHVHVAPMMLGSNKTWCPPFFGNPMDAPRWDLVNVRSVDGDVHVTLVPRVR